LTRPKIALDLLAAALPAGSKLTSFPAPPQSAGLSFAIQWSPRFSNFCFSAM